MRVIILFLILYFTLNHHLQAQENAISIYGGYGFCVPHHADMWNYISKHSKQIDISYFSDIDSLLPGGKNLRKGLSLTFIDPGNPNVMGYGLGLYPQLHFPFNSKKKRSWFILGCGLEYNTKTYSDENYRFNAISSHFNALILLGFKKEFSISNKWSIGTRFMWTHYSNGATKAPNLGLNIPTIGLDITHYMPSTNSIKEKNEVFSNPKWQFLFNGSWKQIKAEGSWYPAFILSVEKNISKKRRNFWGIGSDLICDMAMQDMLLWQGDSNTTFANNIKIAIKGMWTAPIGNLQLSLQAGTYLKNSYFSKQFIFQRLALRYRFTENIAAAISLRAHFAKADAVEVGLVYTLQ